MGKEVVASAPSDNELMVRLRNGDTNALGLLYERYASFVFEVIHKRTKDPDLAMDVVQDTFIKVWKADFDVESKGSFEAWLRVIARNSFVDNLRKGRREVYGILDKMEPGEERPFDVENGQASPEEVAEGLERRRYIVGGIRQAINNLPPTQASAVRLRYEKELKFREVARQMGQNENTVKTWVRRAGKVLARNPRVQALRNL